MILHLVLDHIQYLGSGSALGMVLVSEPLVACGPFPLLRSFGAEREALPPCPGRRTPVSPPHLQLPRTGTQHLCLGGHPRTRSETSASRVPPTPRFQLP